MGREGQSTRGREDERCIKTMTREGESKGGMDDVGRRRDESGGAA